MHHIICTKHHKILSTYMFLAPLTGVHEMHGRVGPIKGTCLSRTPLSHPPDTTNYLEARYLLTKTLVARQLLQSTNNCMYTHTYYMYTFFEIRTYHITAHISLHEALNWTKMGVTQGQVRPSFVQQARTEFEVVKE